jgi:DNA-binding beta-propeller fold protein YncE
LGAEGLADLSRGARRAGPAETTIYVQSNNPQEGQNAVLAFQRDARGNLRQIGEFATGGTGQLNVPKLVGPDDGDKQVVATPDGRFLFTVNQGSDSISSFRIRRDGGLELIGVFGSRGDQPDGLSVIGDRLYVANRGDAAGVPGTTEPNVTGFFIGGNGALTPIPDSTISFAVDTLATQVEASPDGRFLFVNLASFSPDPVEGGNTVVPFAVQTDGTLELAPGGFVGASDDPTVQLGITFHPDLNIVYAGLAADAEVGVFTYDETGRTSFVGDAADSGLAPCWLVVSADGRFIYVANTATDSISVYSLADPLRPVEIQELELAGPRSGGDNNAGLAQAFEIALSPDGRSLFVVTQTTDPSFPEGNQLHTLRVARDGTLSEPRDPIIFDTDDVPAIAHPQGVLAVAGIGRGRDRDDRDDRGRDDGERDDRGRDTRRLDAALRAGPIRDFGVTDALSALVRLLDRGDRD